jgi:hypothetical protein
MTVKNNALLAKPLFVTPYILGMPINPIKIDQFNTWNFTVGDESLESALEKKDFYFLITGVNGTEIPAESEEKIHTLLFTKDWNKFAKQIQ